MEMKRIKFTAIIACALVCLLAACGNDEVTNEVSQHTLKVVSANTSFDALGGTDSIYVNVDAAKAYAMAPWAKAETKGKLVTVTADVNKEMQSRHTTVVIKSADGDSTIVAIDQQGPVTQIDLPEQIVMGDKADTLTYKVKSTFDVSIKSLDSWLTTTYQNDVVTIITTENNEGHVRTGQFVVETTMGKDTISVTQIDLDRDVLGEYYLQLTETDENRKPVKRVYAVKLHKEDKKLMLTFTANPFAFPVTFSAKEGTLSIAGGQFAGMFDNDYVATIVGPMDGQLSVSPNVTISGQFGYSAELPAKVSSLEGTFLHFGTDPAFVLGRFSSKVFENKTYKSYLLYGNDAYLFKRKQ